MEQLQARDSEVEAAAQELKRAEEKVQSLEGAKQELSAAAEKARETVSARAYVKQRCVSELLFVCMTGITCDGGGGSRSTGCDGSAECSRCAERLC